MVIFFRKIRQKLLSDGQLKIYTIYAVGEMLLVTIGILLALQVDNWNKDRLESLEEKRLLSAISEEMQTNRFRNSEGQKNHGEVIAAAERLLAVINNSARRTSTEQLDKDIQILMRRWFGSAAYSTYDVLTGAGQLGMLSSVELRNKLADLELQMELLGRYETIQAEFIDEQMSPFLNHSMDRLPGSADWLELSDSLSESRFSTSYEDLLNNRTFSNLLIDLIRHTRPVIVIYVRIGKMVTLIDSLAVQS